MNKIIHEDLKQFKSYLPAELFLTNYDEYGYSIKKSGFGSDRII